MSKDTAIYDNPTFLANYLDLPRQQQGHDGAPEWPILMAMVGTVREERVLDLGCGLGWFAHWAVENSAQHVDVLDVSNKMIEKAKGMTASLPKRIDFRVQDISSRDLGVSPGSYNLVYSSLAFHHLSTAAFKRLLAQVNSALVHGGRLVFSVEHPIYTAPGYDQFVKVDLPGRHGADLIWPLNRYGYEGLRETNWLGGEVKKYHRTMTTYFESLLEAGFLVSGFREYMATGEDLEKNPQWQGALQRPMFLLLQAENTARTQPQEG
ncbi:ubiquinone/menaquinone biosynthesis methylase-like protein [Karstenula rhodostoma CBS 690.94]|uniref:Ubiquinone/menaquinone biosynthesis methylase-like protein n=1 Tax=Karstenula rhodostoma CBS 690.94 TaxID=1392251 RepID=A0A9P4PYY7_9PLEO|nr:ubiquinone/menaquinone biosynthesis methylase-like protein [Karstenula rhodostoma CBS 690.94]